MLFSDLYKIMVNKVTIVGIKGGDRPHRPALDPPLDTLATHLDLAYTE